MSSDEVRTVREIEVDTANLYREDVFTDLKVASLRRLVPVNPDGSVDETRPVKYVGETQLMSQMGLLPVSCAIEATDLADAIAQFPEAIQEAVEQMVEQARELQRQEASRIVVPGRGPGGMGGPGGGKIQLG